ncbi:MAG TPA: calcium-binding protein, partial [Rhodobacterales bacterium]|nr:calcium-binding protein [Rhodobacterales bacterium]
LAVSGPVLSPVMEDDDPFAGDPVDPDSVLTPITDDDEPFIGDDVDPDTVLDPVDEIGEDAPAPEDATPLQDMLASETDFDAASGWLGDYGPETETETLDPGDNWSGADDGLSGTGQGPLSTFEGTPVVDGDGSVQVIMGGAGDNAITLGDDPAYAFGGDGNDTLTAGEGAAALFGGTGDDLIAASGTGLWADGGSGNDHLTGGAGDDTLWGGAHGEGGDARPDDDTISGGGGDDTVSGGYGADTLSGGDGDDIIDHLGRVESGYSTTHVDDFDKHIDNDADTLDGGAGNDTLLMDRADTATGGAGQDTFWVFFDDSSGAGVAEVTDFKPGEDFLRITLNPELDHGDMALTIDPSDNGEDAEISVNGEMIAVLRGAAGASASDVLVELGQNAFD